MDSAVADADTSIRPRRSVAVLLAVASLVLVVDQATKWWALDALTDPPRTIDLFWTLRFRVIYNTGTAFGLTEDSGRIVSVIAVGVVAYLVHAARQQASRLVVACYGSIVGGTVGNVVDRLFRDGDGFLGGPVIDFVDAQWFPVFNVADAALVIGIALLIIVGLVTDPDPEPDAGPSGAGPTGTDAASRSVLESDT